MRFLKSASKYFLEYSRKSKEKGLELFVDSLKFCQPFVFDNSYLEKDDVIPKSMLDKTLYLPFKVCSFEFLKPILLTDPNGDTHRWQENTSMIKPMLVGKMFIENDDLSIDRFFLICEGDLERDVWFENMNYTPKMFVSHTYHYDNYEDFNSDMVGKAELSLLNGFNGILGQLTAKTKVKKNGRLPELVSKIIVIKGKSGSITSLNGIDIEWKHSWRVRGHWRKISTSMLGKDREGDYSIVGRTWIKDFVKGEGPLIEKTRILKGEENHVRN